MNKYGIRELRHYVGYPCLVFFTGLDGKTVYDATGNVLSVVHHWLTLGCRQDGAQIDLSGEHIIHIDKIEHIEEVEE